MSDNFKDASTPIIESDYDSLVTDLRNKYKQKMEIEKKAVEEKIEKAARDALGAEFSALYDERTALMKEFEKSIKKLFAESDFATDSDKLTDLMIWIKQNDKTEKQISKEKFRSLIQEIGASNQGLVKRVNDIQDMLEDNDAKLTEHIKRNGEKIRESQTSIYNEFKKVVLKLVLEFNLELKHLRQRFNLPPIKFESPFKDKNLTEHVTVKKDSNGGKPEIRLKSDAIDDVDDMFVFDDTDNDDLN